MSWFDAVCHTFATLATGGFSTLDASIAGFDSRAIHLVIILFMILAGVNFGLYHQLIHRQWRDVLRDPELRVYLSIMLLATVIVTICLLRNPPPAGDSAQVGTTAERALFQVVSIQTTTGFCSDDFDLWSFVPKGVLLALMFIGASAGSTGGGIKVVRIMIAAKVMLAELEHMYRPSVVRSVKVGRSTVEPDLKINTLVYLCGILLLFMIGTVLLKMLEASNGIDMTTAATASAATLNNIGPGLARVGATQDYAWFTAPSKVVMSILMLVGRLEMFTIVILFSPRFWRVE
jgi:trk system potassium uptake protein TrkH